MIRTNTDTTGIHIDINGTPITASESFADPDGMVGRRCVNMNYIEQFTAGDVVRFWGFQASGLPLRYLYLTYSFERTG